MSGMKKFIPLLDRDGSFVEPLVREGDMVIVSPRARAIPIPMGDKTYQLITEGDILGIIEN
ncbi:hypothetical protein DICPUDRAFT_153503 [Dictyostelium purpureum]|uniref:10 kDa chaperonin n=1 Tax=Dictyostelium purpureum TaxID=5786 RepID=F0ZP29_DICPU|nr:uncharacterized protein DICPUDRAFT_153503 [Dictyostelium purpureum]EGC34288.1 hypothetical protein DICPUDRAFT_153503 [Dictyostelium purpureum]|eukprot:XP_003289170.1 hypothetical protein DICPUDRAFT_153503 [Dictyostelium purpureum]